MVLSERLVALANGYPCKVSSVNVLPMANLDYLHDQVLIFDGIKDAVTSLPHPVLILPGYFLASRMDEGPQPAC